MIFNKIRYFEKTKNVIENLSGHFLRKKFRVGEFNLIVLLAYASGTNVYIDNHFEIMHEYYYIKKYTCVLAFDTENIFWENVIFFGIMSK